MGHTEFALAASIAKLTERDVRTALTEEIVRKGMTGFWMKEAADPGALLVFSRALSNVHSEEE